ncbi:MAG: ROK family protein [Chloroflexi bacterium]|nr:ROK family protein [Chloroflexota bacterium]
MLAIGIDLGGTKIEAALVAQTGQVLATVRRPTPTESVSAVVKVLADCVRHLQKQAPAPVEGIGLGTPGQVDSTAGIVRRATNLGWENVPLHALLTAELGGNLPLFIQRDSAAELLAERYFGAGRDCANLVYLNLGTGLGGAALVDGHLVVGHTFTASEIGHIVLDPHGRPCSCGLRGCAETLVSGTGFVAHTRQLLAAGQHATSLAEPFTSGMVLRAAEMGDELATAVVSDTAAWLAQLVAAYAIILNPQRVVIGGGFGRAAFHLLIPRVQADLPHLVLASNHAELEIVPSQLDSSALGAAGLVWQGQKNLLETLFKESAK